MGSACLLYGIVFAEPGEHAGGHAPQGLPPGVGGAPVGLIEEGGLGAAVSWIEPADLTPNIARALSYAKVVEALHADRAVLPVRYGCLFEDERQVVELLRLRGEEYAAVLRGLDGCVEMGVRVLLPAESSSPRPPSGPETEGASGLAYLAARAARYARTEQVARALAAVVERLRGALDALAERIETDRGATADRGLFSLYYLVKRGAVEPFRLAFRRISRAESARLLLSGPWPPYSFCSGIGDRGSGFGDRHG
jgi:hypothetical protein